MNLLKTIVILTNPRGAHNSLSAYAKMDEVQYETSLYVAKEALPAGVPITDPRWARKLDNSAAWMAEQERLEAEQGRADNEAERDAAEGEREAAYDTAEDARDQAYQGAEDNRDRLYDNAEADRDQAYQAAEDARGSTFTAAEQERAADEDERVADENTRKDHEVTRQGQEELRVEREANRVNKEQERANAETIRVNQETTRQQQEQARQTASATAVNGANTARDGANTARDGAIAAAGLAAGYEDRTSLWRAATGNPVTCYPVPESRLYPRIELVATQDGSGDPSPENVRPIVPAMAVGDALRARVTGQNLFDGLVYGQMSYFGVVDGRDVYQLTHGVSNWWSFNGLAHRQYTVSFQYKLDSTSLGLTQFRFLYSDGSQKSYALSNATWASFTRTSDPNKTLTGFGQSYVNAGRTYIDRHTFQLELGSVASASESYAGAGYDLYTASEALYGLPGAPVIVDADAGVLLVQDGAKIFDGTEAWIYSSAQTTDSRFVRFTIVFPGVSLSPIGMCDKLLWSSSITSASTTEGISGHPTSSNITCLVLKSRLPGWDDAWSQAQKVAAWKAWMAAHPLTVVYQLDPPLTIPISPPAVLAIPRLTRTAARQNVLTVDVDGDSSHVQALTVGYAKSPIRESDELRAAITTLGGTI